MLEISRALYRRLAPRLLPESPAAGRDRRRQALLSTIEVNLERIVAEPDFHRPERRIYLEVRTQFPLLELPQVRQIIDRHVAVAQARAEQLRSERFETDGICQGTLRAGGPCSRRAITGRGYCPSHRHLEEAGAASLAGAAA